MYCQNRQLWYKCKEDPPRIHYSWKSMNYFFCHWERLEFFLFFVNYQTFCFKFFVIAFAALGVGEIIVFYE